MQAINYSEARNQLAGLVETAVWDRGPITITRSGNRVVLLQTVEGGGV